jgi:RNA-directed DNA polymerase
MKRKLGNGPKLEPNALSENHAPGGRETATSPWGVLSGIVLSAWESHVHGEGPDGSTQLAKETRAGHVGLDQHESTSLQGISNRAQASKDHRFQNLYQCLNAEFLRECWQDLNQDAASGVDGVTAAQYQENLEENIQDLVRRLKTKCYRAKLVRRCYIPKENGEQRPLGIPALEDKLVQLACAKLLNAIYEQDFLDFSNGYRPNRSAKETVADLTFNLQYGRYGYIVEADIKSFFDTIDHDELLEMLAQRIDDQAFLNLIRKWLKAGILDTDGTILDSETGTPQGGVISPILANVYLHYALDLWFETVVKKHVRGEAMMCRYADDFVCAFRFEEDAESFYRVLPKRLGKFGLEVAPEKTRVLRFSRFHPGMKRRFTFSGIRVVLVPRSARRNASQAPDIAQEAPGRLSADQGMDQKQSPPQGKAVYQGAQPAVARALQLLRTPGQQRISLPLLQVGQAVCVQMAQPTGRKAQKLYLGSVRKSVGSFRYSPP